MSLFTVSFELKTYSGNQWQVDPYRQSVIKDPYVRDKNPDIQLPAGDTHILYSDHQNIYGSIRLRAHAVGCEDYELLKQLRQKDPQSAREITQETFRAFNDYETQVKKYREVRSRLIRLASN